MTQPSLEDLRAKRDQIQHAKRIEQQFKLSFKRQAGLPAQGLPKMKLSQAFPTSWISVEDVKSPQTLTIYSCDMEEVGPEKELKLVIGFAEREQKLIVNRTNATTIAALHGDDTDEWVGKPITLYRTTATYGGKVMPAIRVR